jgi:hypothetical protein
MDSTRFGGRGLGLCRYAGTCRSRPTSPLILARTSSYSSSSSFRGALPVLTRVAQLRESPPGALDGCELLVIKHHRGAPPYSLKLGAAKGGDWLARGRPQKGKDRTEKEERSRDKPERGYGNETKHS